MPRVLVIGFGNPGRRDDGLGPALADRLEILGRMDLTVEADYQLSVEHAELAARHDVVVFVDAAADVGVDRPYYLRRVDASPDTSYSSHALSPSAVLHLAAECFGCRPRGWLLGIRPADIDSFAEGLTPEGQAHLESALGAFLSALDSNEMV
ncbi:MAG: hydrogenase maturation protease [Polyangiaceae bacterium]|jgi:hydrogenase maturation protease